MKMTKQHFELIAETIANLETFDCEGMTSVDLDTLVREFADLLASSNGMFDRGRFERACNTPNYRAPRNVTRY